MDIALSDSLIQVASVIAGAGAVYGAIKQDLKNMHEKIKGVEELAKETNKSINGHISDHAHRRFTDHG